jgi:hypothetical protein
VKFLLDHDVPDDLSYFRFAHDAGCVLLTCNRDDFLPLAATHAHLGVVIIIRRRTRGDERAALFRLLDRAGDTGLRNNVNFA